MGTNVRLKVVSLTEYWRSTMTRVVAAPLTYKLAITMYAVILVLFYAPFTFRELIDDTWAAPSYLFITGLLFLGLAGMVIGKSRLLWGLLLIYCIYFVPTAINAGMLWPWTAGSFTVTINGVMIDAFWILIAAPHLVLLMFLVAPDSIRYVWKSTENGQLSE